MTTSMSLLRQLLIVTIVAAATAAAATSATAAADRLTVDVFRHGDLFDSPATQWLHSSSASSLSSSAPRIVSDSDSVSVPSSAHFLQSLEGASDLLHLGLYWESERLADQHADNEAKERMMWAAADARRRNKQQQQQQQHHIHHTSDSSPLSRFLSHASDTYSALLAPLDYMLDIHSTSSEEQGGTASGHSHAEMFAAGMRALNQATRKTKEAMGSDTTTTDDDANDTTTTTVATVHELQTRQGNQQTTSMTTGSLTDNRQTTAADKLSTGRKTMMTQALHTAHAHAAASTSSAPSASLTTTVPATSTSASTTISCSSGRVRLATRTLTGCSASKAPEMDNDDSTALTQAQLEHIKSDPIFSVFQDQYDDAQKQQQQQPPQQKGQKTSFPPPSSLVFASGVHENTTCAQVHQYFNSSAQTQTEWSTLWAGAPVVPAMRGAQNDSMFDSTVFESCRSLMNNVTAAWTSNSSSSSSSGQQQQLGFNSTLVQFCSLNSRCYTRQYLCHSWTSTLEFCVCPFDALGDHCEQARVFQCELELVWPRMDIQSLTGRGGPGFETKAPGSAHDTPQGTYRCPSPSSYASRHSTPSRSNPRLASGGTSSLVSRAWGSLMPSLWEKYGYSPLLDGDRPCLEYPSIGRSNPNPTLSPAKGNGTGSLELRFKSDCRFSSPSPSPTTTTTLPPSLTPSSNYQHVIQSPSPSTLQKLREGNYTWNNDYATVTPPWSYEVLRKGENGTVIFAATTLSSVQYQVLVHPQNFETLFDARFDTVSHTMTTAQMLTSPPTDSEIAIAVAQGDVSLLSSSTLGASLSLLSLPVSTHARGGRWYIETTIQTYRGIYRHGIPPRDTWVTYPRGLTYSEYPVVLIVENTSYQLPGPVNHLKLPFGVLIFLASLGLGFLVSVWKYYKYRREQAFLDLVAINKIKTKKHEAERQRRLEERRERKRSESSSNSSRSIIAATSSASSISLSSPSAISSDLKIEGEVLRTQRLVLRLFSASDAAFSLRLMNSPSWLEQIGDRGIHDLAAAEKYIITGPIESYKQHGLGHWVVCLPSADGSNVVPIGQCGLMRRPGLDKPDIGFAFLVEYCGHGYATEAAAAVLKYAHETLGIAEVVAITKPTNTRSRNLLEKIGMRFARDMQLPGSNQVSSLYTDASEE